MDTNQIEISSSSINNQLPSIDRGQQAPSQNSPEIPSFIETLRGTFISLETTFFSFLQESQCPTALYLTNGIKLQGQIVGIEQDIILLQGTSVMLVYKHAIATVVVLSEEKNYGNRAKAISIEKKSQGK